MHADWGHYPVTVAYVILLSARWKRSNLFSVTGYDRYLGRFSFLSTDSWQGKRQISPQSGCCHCCFLLAACHCNYRIPFHVKRSLWFYQSGLWNDQRLEHYRVKRCRCNAYLTFISHASQYHPFLWWCRVGSNHAFGIKWYIWYASL